MIQNYLQNIFQNLLIFLFCFLIEFFCISIISFLRNDFLLLNSIFRMENYFSLIFFVVVFSVVISLKE